MEPKVRDSFTDPPTPSEAPTPEKQQAALARLRELHAQSIPYIEARDILLKEGYTPLEIFNGAYLFNKADPNEDTTLEQKNFNDYMLAHPEKQEEIIDGFTALEVDREKVD